MDFLSKRGSSHFSRNKKEHCVVEHTLKAPWISIKSIKALVLPLFSHYTGGNAREGKATDLWEMWF